LFLDQGTRLHRFFAPCRPLLAVGPRVGNWLISPVDARGQLRPPSSAQSFGAPEATARSDLGGGMRPRSQCAKPRDSRSFFDTPEGQTGILTSTGKGPRASSDRLLRPPRFDRRTLRPIRRSGGGPSASPLPFAPASPKGDPASYGRGGAFGKNEAVRLASGALVELPRLQVPRFGIGFGSSEEKRTQYQ
jgi:hypothetical protein